MSVMNFFQFQFWCEFQFWFSCTVHGKKLACNT